MFAVDHALTALVVKRRYPTVSLAVLLVCVQALELAWVVLNYLGIEHTTTDAQVQSVANIHLAYMPYSHSVATAIVAALVVWAGARAVGHSRLGQAAALEIVSHLVLDLLTHGHDIALFPGSKIGRASCRERV